MWYKLLESMRSFAVMEVLRLTAQTSCLSDLYASLAQLDCQIIEILRSKQPNAHPLLAEMQLRLFYYMSAYLQRLSKKVSLQKKKLMWYELL